MGVVVHTQLNQAFEILGLLHVCHHPKLLELSHVAEQLAELGINGEELYKKYETLLKRYVAAFRKEFVLDEADSVFFDDDGPAFLFFLQILFAEMPAWIDDIESVSEREIVDILMEGLGEWLAEGPNEGASIHEIIDVLKKSELPPNVCWKLMLLLQEPKKQIVQLVQLIRRNIPAYEHALRTIEKPLQKRLEQFVKTQRNAPKGRAEELVSRFDVPPVETVIPVLISPTVEIYVERSKYAGLFIEDTWRMIENLKKARNSNNPVFKALSDSSKFDILLSLNHSPKYNLELAEHLGLTAATVSHHMQMLLMHGLVSVEKRDGRVYYTLQRDVMKNAIAELREIFSI